MKYKSLATGERHMVQQDESELLEFIAQVIHAANNGICEFNNEETKSWDELPEHMRQGLISSIKTPMSPKEAHEAWMKNRLENGWTYGVEKNIEKKTSPCLIPYDELPPEQRVKDYVKNSIVRLFSVHNDSWLFSLEEEE